MKPLWLALLLCLGLAPAQAQQLVPQTTNQISLPGTIASVARIVTGVPGKSIIVTAVMLVPVATAVVTFSTGTGTNCNTGTANVVGVMTFAAGQTLMLGDGYGAVWVLPPGNDLCITITTAAAPGSLAYALF